MLMKAVTVGGGGTKVSLKPTDINNPLYTINTKGGYWTATEDCVMCCKIAGGSTAWAQVFVEDRIFANVILTTGGSARIGMDNDGNVQNYGYFIPKGTKILTRAAGDGSGDTYNIKFFKPDFS